MDTGQTEIVQQTHFNLMRKNESVGGYLLRKGNCLLQSKIVLNITENNKF